MYRSHSNLAPPGGHSKTRERLFGEGNIRFKPRGAPILGKLCSTMFDSFYIYTNNDSINIIHVPRPVTINGRSLYYITI